MRRREVRLTGSKGLALVLALALLIGILAGCSGANDDADRGDSASAPMQEQAAPSEAPAAVAEGSSASTAVQFSEAMGDASSSSEDKSSMALQGSSSNSASSAVAPTVLPSGAGASIGTIADANAGYNRKMIYTANIVLKADSFTAAEEAVNNAIFQSGGYIVQFADTKSGSEIGSTYVIKVPSAGLSDFLALLENIPNDGFDRKMQGNDVSEEYVDLESRLSAKQAVEARLLAFMDKATKADDLVKFSSQLGGVQEEIEQIKGRMRYIDQNVAYSTVNLRLYQTIEREDAAADKKEEKALGAKLADTMRSSANVLGDIGEALLTFLAAVLPVLAVAIVIGGPIVWGVVRSRGSRRERAEQRRRLLNAGAAASGGPTASPAYPVVPEEDKGEDESKNDRRTDE
ncbi:DUF4349 domain-containing protein [Cohnella fermenti]|uniref:DUF4349 domain-containing protein n=1 Tax=Cohnella fermenti TaxID=2565925 RepID=A0A4S4BLX6_9BACL|nr:DUF4349 domain-containing protein [Cohnella fermenti]THF75603.1 DUF4349 domain-containing protein [Cohnella fermenti]